MLSFCHAGKMGDILYSLYFCRQLSRKYDLRKFNFHIQTNVLCGNEVLITKQRAQFMRSILQSQSFIEKLTIGPNKPKNYIDLNRFRSGIINCNGGDLRDFYYQFNSNTLPRHFEISNIKLKEPADQKYKDKIIFTLSQRYVNPNLDFNVLASHKNDLVFFGTQKEYEAFCSKYFIIPNYQIDIDSLATVAKYIAGAKGFMGNQNGFFALAECMKVPRILLPAEWNKEISGKLTPGPKNVVPVGGWTAVISISEKMKSAVEDLLKYVEIDNRRTKGEKKND